MDQTRLHALLTELDRELKAAGTLDERSQALLAQVLADVPALEDDAVDPGQRRSVEADLRALVLRFEADYPRLSGIVGQLADTLGKIGI